jgi:hypothetical protein
MIAYQQITAKYALYHTMPEFFQGFGAYHSPMRRNPHDPNSVAAQAWGDGLEAAKRYSAFICNLRRDAVKGPSPAKSAA